MIRPSDDRVILGIDGGGSGCRARLVDRDGRIMGEGRSGSANLGLGAGVAAASVVAAASAAFDAAGLDVAQSRSAVAGLGLAGANVPGLAEAFLAEPLPFEALWLASDAVTACLGAHSGRDGAILIVGTGTQGLLLDDGRTTTVGGWGFAIGDGGSGAILGRELIRAAIRSFEGLSRGSPLTKEVMTAIGGTPADAVAWAHRANPRDYAKFAPMLFRAAAEGDDVAVQIVRAGAAEVDWNLDALRRLGADRIALVGGLAHVYRPWLDPLTSGVLVEAEGDAMDGAIHLARLRIAEGGAAKPRATARRSSIVPHVM